MASNKKISERGQALVIVAAGIIGLVAMVGLAVDGGMAFSDRRQAQNAADTAAMAGAWAKARPQYTEDDVLIPWDTVARDRAEENGYTGDLVRSEVEVYTCDDPDASCEYPYDTIHPGDYVQVIITSHVNTFFAKVVGIPQVHNRVQAVALAYEDHSGPLGSGKGIFSFATECESPDNFVVEGGTQVTVIGGGLYSNTDDPACGFKCDSNANTIIGDIATAGGTIDISENCSTNSVGSKTENDVESQLDFPVTLDDIGFDIPPECDPDAPLGSYLNLDAGDVIPNPEDFGLEPGDDYYGPLPEKVTLLYPGRYGQFPPPKLSPVNLNDVMIMQSGTYCVSDVIRWSQPRFVLIGHDVTIFLREGYDFAFSGGVIQLDAPDTGDYAGYLIVVEPDYGDPPLSNPSDTACFINGNVDNSFTGTIFAPYCQCTIDGGGKTIGFNAQLLCYTVDIKGGGSVTFTYDPEENGEQILPPKIGPTK